MDTDKLRSLISSYTHRLIGCDADKDHVDALVRDIVALAVPPVPSDDDDDFGPAPTNAELGLSTVPPVPGTNIMDDVEDLISFYRGEHIFFTDVRDGCCPKSDRCDPVVLVNEFVSELKKLLRSPSVAPVPIHISNGLSVSSEANPVQDAVKALEGEL